MTRLTKMAQVAHTAWGGSMVSAIVAYFAPMTEIFIVLLLFVIFDLVTGVFASRKAKVSISSRRLRLSVVKLISYVSVMLLIYSAESAFGLEWLDSYKFTGGFICFVELISILENLAILTEKRIFLNIIKFLRGKAADKHGTMVTEILDEKNGKTVSEILKDKHSSELKTDKENGKS